MILKYKIKTEIKINTFIKSKISNSLYKKIKQNGKIIVNNQFKYLNQMLFPGDILTLKIKNEKSNISPIKGKLKIIFEDEHLLIINKQINTPVLPPRNDEPSLANFVANYYFERKIQSNIHIVNRLDKNTTGLIIFAKNSLVHHKLQSQKIIKKYYALVDNNLQKIEDKTVNNLIDLDNNSILKRKISFTKGKNAITKITEKERLKRLSIIQLELITGRTHQIRVQMEYLKLPLINDWLYETKTTINYQYYLESSFLKFIHPITNQELEFVIPRKTIKDLYDK